MIDSMAVTADTFELPNPNPSVFPLAGSPGSLAISGHDHHMFVLDYYNVADEYSYPDGTLIGTVNGTQGSIFTAIAVDP